MEELLYICNNDAARWDKNSRELCPVCGSEGFPEEVAVIEEVVEEPKKTIKKTISKIVKKLKK